MYLGVVPKDSLDLFYAENICEKSGRQWIGDNILAILEIAIVW